MHRYLLDEIKILTRFPPAHTAHPAIGFRPYSKTRSHGMTAIGVPGIPNGLQVIALVQLVVGYRIKNGGGKFFGR